MLDEDLSKLCQVFIRDRRAPSGRLMIAGGVGGLCLAAIGFVVAIVTGAGTISMHAMTTLPTIMSIGALTAGWSMLRTPRRVFVGPDELAFETAQGMRRLRWDEVGSATVGSGSMNQRRHLNVTDVRGKTLLKVDESSFEDFDEMVVAIARHVASKGDHTAARLARRKAKRQGVISFVVGSGLIAAAVFVGWDARENQRAERLLKAKGKAGEGEIVRRFTAPNGVTRRVEYRVGNSTTRNVEVRPEYWERLKGAKTIPVVYVPEEPGISRLVDGEVKEDDFTKTPQGTYLVAVLGGLMGLFFFGMSPLMWNGWDLAQDSRTGQWQVKQYGTVVWSTRGRVDRSRPRSSANLDLD